MKTHQRIDILVTTCHRIINVICDVHHIKSFKEQRNFIPLREELLFSFGISKSEKSGHFLLRKSSVTFSRLFSSLAAQINKALTRPRMTKHQNFRRLKKLNV